MSTMTAEKWQVVFFNQIKEKAFLFALDIPSFP